MNNGISKTNVEDNKRKKKEKGLGDPNIGNCFTCKFIGCECIDPKGCKEEKK